MSRLWSRFKEGKRLQNAADLERDIQDLEERGLIGQQEGEMMESLLDFGETLAREIMVPRTEVKALSLETEVNAIIDLVRECGHTRFPVHAEDIDQVQGILHVKDLLPFWGQAKVDLAALLRPVPFVPETKRITDLLADMRGLRSHMAVVIDEYGGTAGILTIEDIIEEIVGEIQDEHDDEEPLLEAVNENEAVVDARMDVEDLQEYFQTPIDKNGFETVAGLITSLTGDVPAKGQAVDFQGLTLTIEESDERRIRKVRVSRTSSTL